MAEVPTSPKHEKRRYPYADAQYRVYKLDDCTFGIYVTIPDMLPTKVTSFPTRKAAKQWVANHRETVESQGSNLPRPAYVRKFAPSGSDKSGLG